MFKDKLTSLKEIRASEIRTLSSNPQSRTETHHSVEESLDLANKALQKRNFTHSLYVLDSAIDLSPDNPRLITARAKVYIIAKMWEDALEQVDYLLYLDPDNEDANGAKELLIKKISYTKLVTAHPLYS